MANPDQMENDEIERLRAQAAADAGNPNPAPAPTAPTRTPANRQPNQNRRDRQGDANRNPDAAPSAHQRITQVERRLDEMPAKVAAAVIAANPRPAQTSTNTAPASVDAAKKTESNTPMIIVIIGGLVIIIGGVIALAIS